MSRKFWVFVIALMAMMLILEYQMPRRFVWDPTFAHEDPQPFGCYVFDSLLSREMPCGYTVCRKTVSQLVQEQQPPRSIIILCSGYHAEHLNIDNMLLLAERGNRILYANSYFANELCDTLNIHCNSKNLFDASVFQKTFVQEAPNDSIYWVGDSAVYNSSITRIHPQFLNACMLDTKPAVPLAKINNWSDMEFLKEHVREDSPFMKDDPSKLKVADVVALSYPIGKGELILVTTPLMFTNYGILNNPVYVHRLLNRLKPLPVVRTEAYMSNFNKAETSPFRELLKRPPLRWALYLILLGIVLMMGFNARRRQRAIPVKSPPRNYQLDFIRHIGTLQYTKSKNSPNTH